MDLWELPATDLSKKPAKLFRLQFLVLIDTHAG